MRILITGAAGYIGSVAVERALLAGHDVVAVDNLWRGHRAAVDPAASFYPIDLTDHDTTLETVRASRPDAVLHFAASTIVPESVADPAGYFRNNLLGGFNLLEAVRTVGVRRIVFSSTAAVYGEPRSLPIDEEQPTLPINPYGQSKLAVEQMLAAYDRAYGLRFAALRYFNVAGATEAHGEDHDPETHVVPVALQAVAGMRPAFAIYGTDYPTADGTAVRDYVHVVDLVDAHLVALDRLAAGPSLGAVNLGTKEGFSVRQVVEAVERVTGRPLPLREEPRRAGDPSALIADSTKARQLLGWSPQRSTLDQMVDSAWRWMERHPNGYDD